jgi:transposase
VAQLDEIPGVGRIGAQELIAEIGMEMSRFPSAAHLVSWANLAPTTKASAGKTRVQLHRQGQPLDRCHHRGGGHGSLQDHDLPLGSRYRRIVKRRGKKRALVAVGNQVLAIAYCLLSDPDARFVDLGADVHDRLHPQRRTRQLIRELEHVSGKQVTLHDAA